MGSLPRTPARTAETVIWHNSRCSKSRQTLALLEQHGVAPQIVHYLDDPPSADDIERVLALLAIEPRQLMRTKEPPYAALGLADRSLDRAALVRAMAENPILIERPVVIRGGRAALGRPPENALALLDS